MRRIPFQTPLVQAFLAGRKTQTRRVIKPQPTLAADGNLDFRNKRGEWIGAWRLKTGGHNVVRRYQVGEVVAMGEALVRGVDYFSIAPLQPVRYIARYAADDYIVCEKTWPWKRNKLPSVFMPLWAARRFFLIVRAWPHRLHDMSCEDILAEGIEDPGDGGRGYGWREIRLRYQWRHLWDSINAKPEPMRRSKRPLKRPRKPSYPWAGNPWVFAYKLAPADKPSPKQGE